MRSTPFIVSMVILIILIGGVLVARAVKPTVVTTAIYPSPTPIVTASSQESTNNSASQINILTADPTVLINSTFRDALQVYLQNYIGKSSHTGGQVFCSYDTLGADRTDASINGYLWAICDEFYKTSSGNVLRGSRISTPVVLTAKTTPQNVQLTYQTPRTGASFKTDVSRMFPSNIRSLGWFTSDTSYITAHTQALEKDNIQSATKVFGTVPAITPSP